MRAVYFIADTNILAARNRLLAILQKLLDDYPGTIEEDLALLQDYRLDIGGDLLSPDMKVVVQFRLTEKILLSQVIDVLHNSLLTVQAHE